MDLIYNQQMNILLIHNLPGTKPVFELSGNPLVCDCELEWLATYSPAPSSINSYPSSSPLISDYSALACTLPLRQGVTLPVNQVNDTTALISSNRIYLTRKPLKPMIKIVCLGDAGNHFKYILIFFLSGKLKNRLKYF